MARTKRSKNQGTLAKMAKAPSQTASRVKEMATKPGTAQSLAKGAAGVALAATAVAAGAALTSKTYRKNISQTAQNAFEGVKNIASELEIEDMYPKTYQHNIKSGTSNKSTKKAKK